MGSPREFINSTPHVNPVFGSENREFIRKCVHDGPTLWVAGSLGLNLLQPAKFQTVTGLPGKFDGLAALARDKMGGLWRSGRKGLMLLSPAQRSGCAKQCPAPLKPIVDDSADGLKVAVTCSIPDS